MATKDMATKTKATKTTKSAKPTSTARAAAGSVKAPVLGTTRISRPNQDRLLRADPAPLHEVPQDVGAEAVLARVEDLLGKGHFGAALQRSGRAEAQPFRRWAADMSSPAGEAVPRPDRHRRPLCPARRPKERAPFYERALAPDSADPAVKEIAQLAAKTFDDLVSAGPR